MILPRDVCYGVMWRATRHVTMVCPVSVTCENVTCLPCHIQRHLLFHCVMSHAVGLATMHTALCLHCFQTDNMPAVPYEVKCDVMCGVQALGQSKWMDSWGTKMVSLSPVCVGGEEGGGKKLSTICFARMHAHRPPFVHANACTHHFAVVGSR